VPKAAESTSIKNCGDNRRGLFSAAGSGIGTSIDEALSPAFASEAASAGVGGFAVCGSPAAADVDRVAGATVTARAGTAVLLAAESGLTGAVVAFGLTIGFVSIGRGVAASLVSGSISGAGGRFAGTGCDVGSLVTLAEF
jgi:hypothetical protein